MSHELTEKDSMLSASGRKPWHFDLGTPVNLVEGEVTVADGPRESGLDWIVEHRPLYTVRTVGMNPDGSEAQELVEVTDRQAVVRVDNDDYVGNTGMVHELVQNQALFDLAGAIQAEADGQVLVETAGSLKGNRLVWVLARLDRDLTVNGDAHVPYLLLANSHDGSMALRVQTTPIRVVCWNTLSWAIGGQQQAWIARHSTNVDRRVGEIQHALGLSWKYLDSWEADVHRMMDTPVRPREFDRFTERLIPLVPNPTDRQVKVVEDRRSEVRQLHEGDTVAPFTGTAWGAFNAATEWKQWKRPVQGATRAERLGESTVKGDTASNTAHVRALLDDTVPALAA